MRNRVSKQQRALLIHLEFVGPLADCAALGRNRRRAMHSLIRQGLVRREVTRDPFGGDCVQYHYAAQ